MVRNKHGGTTTVLADSWQGRPLNAPNDVVVQPKDGPVWFTNLGYGTLMNYEEHKGKLYVKEAICRIDTRNGKLEMVTDEIYKPNGLCFSPDY